MSSQIGSVDMPTGPRSSELGSFLDLVTSLLYWVVISLLAVAFLNDPPVLTLGVALLGGLILGIEVHQVYERHAPVPHPVSDSPFLHWSITGLIGLNYGWFVFADRPPVAGLLLVGVIFTLRIVHTRVLFTWTPHDFPIILLVLLTLFSGLILTINPSLSLPKVYGVVLSVLVYYEIAYGVRLKENLNRWLIVLSALGIGMAVLGLFGADWFSAKLLNLSKIYAFIPRKIADVPRSLRGGFHPNGVAGTLIFIIPVYAMQLVSALQVGKARRSRLEVLRLVVASLALLFTGGTLLLTQSRGAMLGLGIALVALFFAWQRQWVVSLVALMGMVFLAGLLLVRFPELLGSVDPAESMGVRTTLSSFEFRLTVWRAALQVLQAFPLSGVGIGTFDLVVRHLFPHLYPASLYNPSVNITHAHNELLQVAIDLGIPGFVAYVALLAAFVRTAWRAYTWAPDERIKRLVLGLGAGMLAHQIFGLTDAFMLGTKPGIVMWMIMGLVTGLYLNLAPDHLATSEHG
jgi:putative inorganic carbon (HCO3(-)) transporter